MELHEHLEHVQTKEDLAKFIAALHNDLAAHAESWENPTLEQFLEAMAAWLAATDYLEKTEIILLRIQLGKLLPLCCTQQRYMNKRDAFKA